MENSFKSRNVWSRRWLVVYTRPKWEKKVDRLLKSQEIRSYCPVKRITSQWSDRKKIIDLPLFSGYVFVWVSQQEEYKVKQTLGVLNFVYYMAKPAVIRDSEIERISQLLELDADCEIIDAGHISAGDRIRVKSGIFYNREGTVIRVQGKNVLMVFDNLNCALVSSIPKSNIVLNAAM